jgi:hypothetical protein
MKAYRPTLEGFRAMVRRPSIGAAEIVWRWSFGAAVTVLLAFSLLEYLGTLWITRGEVVLLKTRQPVLISQVMRHVFQGGGLRAMESAMVLTVTLAAGWIVVAGLGRAATMAELFADFRARREAPPDVEAAKVRLRALFELNFFQVAITVAAILGSLAAFLLAGFASSAADPSPGAAFFVFLLVATLVWLAWSMLHWLIMLASVFAADGLDTFAAIAGAVDLYRRRTGAIFAVSTWFGLSHLAAFFVATTGAGIVLGFAGLLPQGVILGGILLVTLLYFAVADYLYVGRLAAWVAVLEWPPAPVVTQTAEYAGNRRGGAVDREELILSDLPADAAAEAVP